MTLEVQAIWCDGATKLMQWRARGAASRIKRVSTAGVALNAFDETRRLAITARARARLF
jgi:hypothetical protein